MASVLGLPTEVVWMILQNLDNVKDLSSAIRTCRWLHQSFLGNTYLAHEVLTAQVTLEVLPYLLLMNKLLGGPCGETFGNVVDFLDDQDGKTKELLAGYRELPFQTLLRLGRYHDMISTMAYRYAAEAWSLIGQENALSLSKSESFQLHRAFYRLELYLHPFRDLAKDLLPHPIDYAIQTHDWAYGSQTRLKDYDDDMLDALLPERRKQGPEKGLFELWRLYHQDVTQFDFINGHCFYRLRQRAYVFWDTERVEQYQLKRKFDRVSGGYDHAKSSKYYDRKEEDSHEAREKIWEAGGYGYWSEGDTSQVKWRDPVANQRILPEKFNPEWFMEQGIVQWMERHLPDEA
ncbi:hypothetical protein HJFPF1_08652 [Paramyrothecium foliicola]|nr:hypothetical protein HJFPF1_08652 [Paramyrothecium foliicola]